MNQEKTELGILGMLQTTHATYNIHDVRIPSKSIYVEANTNKLVFTSKIMEEGKEYHVD